jgi:cobyrinic acid a,c-diamide synthase
MVSGCCPRLVIAGTGSGVGKTSLSAGLARALARQGLRVQAFKVGPDFLDPGYLALASGRTCYNLDGWMTSRDYVSGLFDRVTAGADVAIVEGVMGLFDGASPDALDGSTAEIALWLDAPVLLVANAHGAARSLAATVLGFARFEPALRLSGVLANQAGSPRHAGWLRASLAGAELPPLLGAMPRDALPKLESRHLGLVTAEPDDRMRRTIDELADACDRHLDIPGILDAAGRGMGGGGRGADGMSNDETRMTKEARMTKPESSSAALPSFDHSSLSRHSGFDIRDSSPSPVIRLGIARDAAFQFYYPDNLDSLSSLGAELVPFSPIADARLPEDLDALYLGGGYPELFAPRLSANSGMLGAMGRFAASGRSVYAECGGLMYLGRSIETTDATRHPLAGVLPIDTAMLPRLARLGYVEADLAVDSLWGPAGTRCRGHEFHYSRIIGGAAMQDGWQAAYRLRRPGECAGFRGLARGPHPQPLSQRERGGALAAETEGFARGSVLASYVHLHWASRPEAARHLLDRCKERA